MADILDVFFDGRVTYDPQFHDLPKGGQMARLSLVANNVWRGKDDNGHTKYDPTYVDCKVWLEHLVALCRAKVKKGSWLTLTGSLQMETWTKEDGTQGKALVIRVEKLNVKGAPPKAEPQEARPSKTATGEIDYDKLAEAMERAKAKQTAQVKETTKVTIEAGQARAPAEEPQQSKEVPY